MHENRLQQAQARCKTLGGEILMQQKQILVATTNRNYCNNTNKAQMQRCRASRKTNVTKKNEMVKQQTKAITTAETKKQCEMQHQKNTNTTKEDYLCNNEITLLQQQK
jgi:hypothetical protein